MIPFSDLNEEEKKWLSLFTKGVHRDFNYEDYEENFNYESLTLDHFSEYFPKSSSQNSQTEIEEQKLITETENSGVCESAETALLSSGFVSFDRSLSTIEWPATDLVSVTQIMFCLVQEGVSEKDREQFARYMLAHRDSIYLGQQFSLTSEVVEQFNVLKTPTKKKNELTEEQKNKKLESLNKKTAERSAEMGIFVNRIPIGNIMDGLRKSIKPIPLGMSLEVRKCSKEILVSSTF